jgi:hypothetical protein
MEEVKGSMNYSGTLTVYRPNPEDEDDELEIEVEIEGHVHGPEPDVGLGWTVEDLCAYVRQPDGKKIPFDLTDDEVQKAVDQACETIEEDDYDE